MAAVDKYLDGLAFCKGRKRSGEGFSDGRIWRARHDRFLLKNFGAMSNKEIAKKLGFEPSTVATHARKLGLNNRGNESE